MYMSTQWFPLCVQVQAGAGPPGPHGTAAGGDRGIPVARGQEAPQTSGLTLWVDDRLRVYSTKLGVLP